jgi:Leucine-rich repeat (LRR) protein
MKKDGNNLEGAIPEEIKALTGLRHLSLASNKFSRDRSISLDAIETLRSISQLEGSLISLDVSDNAWDAIIPGNLGRLSNLEILHLNNNGFKSTMPPEFSNLSNLRELYLDGNERMKGTTNGGIEDILMNMPRLEILSAARAGNLRISPDLRFPTSLTLLNLQECNFDDSELTSNIGRLSNLQVLALRDTRLVGAMPTEIGLMTRLGALDLSDNDLSGQFPWSTLNAATLAQLSMEKNGLAGEFPSDISRLTALRHLDISTNQFDGRIPESIGDLTSLTVLDMEVNILTGPIPSTVGKMTNLEKLRLSWNYITGGLPTEMSNMVSLGKKPAAPCRAHA